MLFWGWLESLERVTLLFVSGFQLSCSLPGIYFVTSIRTGLATYAAPRKNAYLYGVVVREVWSQPLSVVQTRL